MKKLIEVKGKNDTYTVLVEVDERGRIVKPLNCDCLYGSFYQFAKKNKGRYCIHVNKILKENAVF